jgi:hypothetical protein
MCAQYMATAAAAGAIGLRAWLATRSWWLTPPRLRRATAAILFCALVLAATGSG